MDRRYPEAEFGRSVDDSQSEFIRRDKSRQRRPSSGCRIAHFFLSHDTFLFHHLLPAESGRNESRAQALRAARDTRRQQILRRSHRIYRRLPACESFGLSAASADACYKFSGRYFERVNNLQFIHILSLLQW